MPAVPGLSDALGRPKSAHVMVTAANASAVILNGTNYLTCHSERAKDLVLAILNEAKHAMLVILNEVKHLILVILNEAKHLILVILNEAKRSEESAVHRGRRPSAQPAQQQILRCAQNDICRRIVSRPCTPNRGLYRAHFQTMSSCGCSPAFGPFAFSTPPSSFRFSPML